MWLTVLLADLFFLISVCEWRKAVGVISIDFLIREMSVYKSWKIYLHFSKIASENISNKDD